MDEKKDSFINSSPILLICSVVYVVINILLFYGYASGLINIRESLHRDFILIKIGVFLPIIMFFSFFVGKRVIGNIDFKNRDKIIFSISMIFCCLLNIILYIFVTASL